MISLWAGGDTDRHPAETVTRDGGKCDGNQGQAAAGADGDGIVHASDDNMADRGRAMRARERQKV